MMFIECEPIFPAPKATMYYYHSNKRMFVTKRFIDIQIQFISGIFPFMPVTTEIDFRDTTLKTVSEVVRIKGKLEFSEESKDVKISENVVLYMIKSKNCSEVKFKELL